MTDFRPGTPDQEEFLRDLLDFGHLIQLGLPGVYGRSEDFERVRLGFNAMVTDAAARESPELMIFPPLMPRRQIEDMGYLKSFPHLACTVFTFDGDEEQAAEQERRADAHEDWSGYQQMSDMVLKPAACYPVYPTVAARGPLPADGATIDVGGAEVFRNEPSGDPARLRAFHMREVVRIADPDTTLEWRDLWRDRSLELLRLVGLEAAPDIANDPFFGRTGTLLARSQRAQELKVELLVPIAGPEPTAVVSANYHASHFSEVYDLDIEGPGGSRTVHTACVGFGLERITLALLRKHGLDIGVWPSPVRQALGLERIEVP
jgi:seryl-tRNA synthetase